jgi:hypothetical protein
MFRWFGKKQKPETVSEKFTRLLRFHADMVVSTRAAIAELRRSDQPALLIENFSHLLHDHSEIAVMQWRRGDDPRTAIAETHEAYREMIACLDAVDPDRLLPMSAIAGITDWDLVHSLFWLTDSSEPVLLHFPRLLEERYFAYSRFILHRVTGAAVPPSLGNAVDQFQTGADALVDRDFRDKLRLLDSATGADEREALITRIEGNWPKRRNAGFYQRSAPLPAGHDASNDLSLDYQLACIPRLLGIARPHGPHAWRWN